MSLGPDVQSEAEQVISLDELTQAFAQALGIVPTSESEGESPSDKAAESVAAEAGRTGSTVAQSRSAAAAEGGVQEDCCEITPRSILEAMLFVGNRNNEPWPAARAAELMRGVEPAEIPGLVDELNRRYRGTGCPYQIVHEGAGYRLVLRKEWQALRNRFYGRIREAHLSQVAIDVLAIVAYQQPLSSEQIGRLRGKPSSHVLSQLVRRGLLRIERTSDRPRSVQYFTTDRFLDLFRLESLADLPRSEELERP